MTVREWFRKERAAMWLDAAHPAHRVASEIDQVAAAIVRGHNIPAHARASVIHYAQADWGRDLDRLHAILGQVNDAYGYNEARRDAALETLLWLAWPAADREKYDHTYSMLRRSGEHHFRGIVE